MDAKLRKAQRCSVRFDGDKVSTITRATMLIVDNPELSCHAIYALLLGEGRNISRSTLDVLYAEDRKVIAYFKYKGLID
jgi:hypothetical protein